MKKNEKIMISILIIITLIVVSIYVIRNNTQKDIMIGKQGIQTEQNQEEKKEKKEDYVQKIEDGTKINTSSKLHETKTLEGLEISNIQLTEKNNLSVLLGTIKNTSTTTQGGYEIDINIVDKKGDKIIKLGGYIPKIEPQESTQLNIAASFDYANAYDFNISKRK